MVSGRSTFSSLRSLSSGSTSDSWQILAEACAAVGGPSSGKLTSADVRYDSIRGRIETVWKTSGDKLTINATIPANTTAIVLVAARSADAITESGKPLAKATGVKFLRMEGDRAVREVEQGLLFCRCYSLVSGL